MEVIHVHKVFKSRKSMMRIVPIGDMHLANRACDEARLKAVIDAVANDKDTYWVGMGDYCEFINARDRRFDPGILSEWIETGDLVDLPRCQVNYVIKLLKPIAHKCLGLIEGNHERVIRRYYERDIYSEIVTGIKSAGKFASDHKLALGYYGWLLLRMERSTEVQLLRFNLHHGFVGGRLAGAKALNMQRWLWNHECDVAIFGHSHNTSVQKEAVESIDSTGKVITKTRRGCFSGTFFRTVVEGASTYSEMKGYFPLPMGGCEILIYPGVLDRTQRIKIQV